MIRRPPRCTRTDKLFPSTTLSRSSERQMLAALTGTALGDAVVPAGAIVVAEDLLPSQLVTLAAAKPAGLCLARGGPTSHVALLCAGMGLLALVALAIGRAHV